MINNPYKQKVLEHKKILVDLEKIYQQKGNWNIFFNNKNKIILEIGTGLGNHFSKMINENLNKNFIGMEIKYKRCFITAEKTLGKMKNNDNSKDNTKLKNYNNNFVILKDYAENVDKIFNNNEIDETLIFFPDPWARKKSRVLKKRLVQKKFLKNLYNITKIGGKFIFKTDHLGYFLHVLYEIEKTDWKLVFKTFDYEKEGLFEKNSVTEFEQIFRGQKIKICYLELVK